MIHHLIYCNLPMNFRMDPNCGCVLPYPIHVHVYKVSRTSWSHHEFIMYTWQSDFLMPVLQQVHDHWPTSSHMKPELFQATGREPQVLQVSSVLENGLVPTSWAGQVLYWKLALSERHRRVCKSATRSSTGRSTSTTSLHEIIQVRELKNCHSFCDSCCDYPSCVFLCSQCFFWTMRLPTLHNRGTNKRAWPSAEGLVIRKRQTKSRRVLLLPIRRSSQFGGGTI